MHEGEWPDGPDPIYVDPLTPISALEIELGKYLALTGSVENSDVDITTGMLEALDLDLDSEDGE